MPYRRNCRGVQEAKYDGFYAVITNIIGNEEILKI